MKVDLLLADCVVLNTGDSVVALHYSIPSAAGASTSPSPVASPAVGYSSQLVQTFGSVSHLPRAASPPFCALGILCALGVCRYALCSMYSVL